jgi:hypothetical protein
MRNTRNKKPTHTVGFLMPKIPQANDLADVAILQTFTAKFSQHDCFPDFPPDTLLISAPAKKHYNG